MAAAVAFLVMVMALPSAMFYGGVSGRFIFTAISTGTWFITLFAGALITADSLARERREGTLGLLFLTDLKGYDVVLGKLAASSVNAMFCLIALVPILAIPLMMGGVTVAEVCRVAAALLATLFLSLSIGIASSVTFKLAQNAIAVSIFVVFLIAFFSLFVSPGSSPALLSQLSPMAAMHFSDPSRFATKAEFYFGSIGLMFFGGTVLLAFASRRVGQSWQTKPPHGFLLWWEQCRRDMSLGNATARRSQRKRLLDVNPILWMHSRARLVQRVVIVVWVTLLIFAFQLNWSHYFHWSDLSATMLTAIFLQVLYLGLLAVESANYLVKTREDGAVELLLSTSLSSQELVHGHFLAARRMFNVPTIALLTYFVAWTIAAAVHVAPERRHLALWLGITMAVNVYLGGRAIVWAALASSLHRKRSLTAAAIAFLQVVLVPWWAVLVISAAGPDSDLAHAISYLVVLLCTHTLVTVLAKDRLNENVRILLSEPPKALTRREFEERFRVE